MKTWKLCAAGLVIATACTSANRDSSAPSRSSTSTSPLAFDDDAVALLSPVRRMAYTALIAKAGRVELSVDTASTAVTGIALDLRPLAASPRDTASKFIARWQTLLDDRIHPSEYVLAPAAEGCGDAVVTFDRYLYGNL